MKIILLLAAIYSLIINQCYKNEQVNDIELGQQEERMKPENSLGNYTHPVPDSLKAGNVTLGYIPVNGNARKH